MVRLFVCGDIVNHIPGLNFVRDDLRNLIQNCDYAVCNFEGPELGPNQTANGPHQKAGTAAYLKKMGFNLMLLSNNHITELGAEGVKYTINTIKSVNADYIGAGLSWEEAYKPIIRDIAGKRFGFFNVCEAQEGQYLSKDQLFGYAWMGYSGLFDDVRKLSKITDFVVVFVHAGLEHYPMPLPEFRDFYKQICDAGASCVVASHPHCAQGYEFFGSKPIIYSLGNFYFPRKSGAWQEENSSYSVILEFDDVASVKLSPVFHRLNNGIVEPQDAKDSIINMDGLCKLLGDGYDKRAEEMCITAYRDLCEELLAKSLCGESERTTLKEAIKNAIRYTIFRNRYVNKTIYHRQELLLRLFENESYRYTIIRTLKTKLSK